MVPSVVPTAVPTAVPSAEPTVVLSWRAFGVDVCVPHTQVLHWKLSGMLFVLNVFKVFHYYDACE